MSPLSRVRRASRAFSALGVTALILTLGVAPMLTSGADHLDAPSLGSISVNPNDSLNVSKVRGRSTSTTSTPSSAPTRAGPCWR